MKAVRVTDDLPCDAAPLVPHEAPMLLVSRLLKREEDKGFAEVEAVAPEEGPFLVDKTVLPEYCIEVMAQAVAVVNGFSEDAKREGAAGFLAGIDDFSWQGQPEPGDRLRVRVYRTLSFGNIHIFSGTITGPSGKLAAGQMKIWINPQTVPGAMDFSTGR